MILNPVLPVQGSSISIPVGRSEMDKACFESHFYASGTARVQYARIYQNVAECTGWSLYEFLWSLLLVRNWSKFKQRTGPWCATPVQRFSLRFTPGPKEPLFLPLLPCRCISGQAWVCAADGKKASQSDIRRVRAIAPGKWQGRQKCRVKKIGVSFFLQLAAERCVVSSWEVGGRVAAMSEIWG